MRSKPKRRGALALVRPMRKRRPSRLPASIPGTMAAAGLAAGLAAAGLAAWKRRSAADDGGPTGSTASTASTAGGGDTHEHPDQRRPWQCECGQDLQVSGDGAHRIFWAPDAAPEDPLLEGRCPACDRELAHQH